MNPIYISYSDKDYDYAHKLAKALKDNKFPVYIEEHTNLDIKGLDILCNCSVFIVIISDSSRSDLRVLEELFRAGLTHKPIFPILLKGNIWSTMQTVQYLDVRSGDLPPKQFYSDLLKLADRFSVSSSIDNQIFVSYSRTDWDTYVQPMVSLLENAGLSLWIDQSIIQGGTNWLDEINQALEKCQVLILCVTPAAIASKYVRFEYRYFLEEDKLLIPVIFEPAKLPAELRPIQHLQPNEISKIVEIARAAK